MKTKVTIDGVELTREQVEAALAKLNEPDTPKFGRWKPEEGEKYYFVDACGDVMSERWDGDSIDHSRLALGNVYRTREEAQNAADRQRAIVAMRDKADRVRTHPEPDRADTTVNKCFTEWDTADNKPKGVTSLWLIPPPEVPVFATPTERDAFIEIAAWEIEYYYTGKRPEGEPLS